MTTTVYVIVFVDNELELSDEASLFTDKTYAEHIADGRNAHVPGREVRRVKVKPMAVYQ